MNKLILLALLLSTSAFATSDKNGVTYDVKIIRVNDGDTVTISAPWVPAPMKKEIAIRVYGVDTPEKGWRAKCESENQRALGSSLFTARMMDDAKHHQVVLMGWDKFGGRILGDFILDGKSLRHALIEAGHAREYFGDAKQSWCLDK
jgi:endonuclease YncB( thermonuclease family)